MPSALRRQGASEPPGGDGEGDGGEGEQDTDLGKHARAGATPTI